VVAHIAYLKRSIWERVCFVNHCVVQDDDYREHQKEHRYVHLIFISIYSAQQKIISSLFSLLAATQAHKQPH
jgi:hypothetical protein